LGAAYVAGFERALADGADVIVQMDADGSHDPGEIPRMVEALRAEEDEFTNEHESTKGYSKIGVHSRIRAPVDLVVGSRRVPGGHVVGWGWHRHFASWAAQALARWLLNIRTRDVTSGFRVWRANALRASLGTRNHESRIMNHGNDDSAALSSGYAFQEELLYRAEQARLRIVEHPITFRDRERGRSKLGPRDILGFFRTLARLWVSDRDRRFTLWLGVALVLLTGLPYLYGWWNTPPGHTFTGIHALSSGDMAVYGSYIEQVREGRWTFVDLFTSEWPQRPRLDIFWLGAGFFARITHLSAPVAFHVLRLLLIIPFTLFLATFVATFFRQPLSGFSVRTVRRTALLLLAFSSGVGAYLAPGFEARAFWRPGYEHWPMDLWVAESNTFLTLFQSPHFIASLWLLLCVMLSTFRFTETRRWRWPIGTGIAALVLFQFHPFYVPTIAAVLAAWALVECLTARRVRWDIIGHVLIVGLISAPSVIYHLVSLSVDPIVAAKAQQNLLLTPAWWLVLVSYGFLVPLAIGGVWRLLRQRSPEARLLIVWLAVTLILIASPLTWQRRLTEGLHVVMVLIAIAGLFPFLAWLHAHVPRWVARYAWGPLTAVIVAVPLLGVSTIFNVLRDIALYTLQYPSVVPRNSIYYPNDSIEAMRWIRTTAQPGDVTFAVGLDGNFLPMYSTRLSALGHGVETTNFVEKYHTSYALARGQLTPADARAFLDRVRTRFILITDASRDLWTISPTTIPGATLVYRNDGARVFELMRP
ncbi:hypothetical protein HY634_00825, partial [Candidatus Uhrbacteria bacterium]|nr:hypothetical protein [Candidatus Uhrbacteria bacterium]